VALYQFKGGKIAIQPRVIAETKLIERQIVVVNKEGDLSPLVVEELEADGSAPAGPQTNGKRLYLKKWWEPVLNMRFDDPEQERPYWAGTNNIVLNTPFPGILIKAHANRNDNDVGIFLSHGPRGSLDPVLRYIKKDKRNVANDLPKGTSIHSGIYLKNENLAKDQEKYAWLIKNLNLFVNVLRPRLKKWADELAK
jgi:hypothetical protein